MTQARARPLFLKRAVGIIRVSEVGDREGEKFVSPSDQRRAIQRVSQTESLRLLDIFEEIDVSAYSRSLARRPGLSKAVSMIERGEADVIVACYFNRLFRKYTVQEEVLRRVEDVGGRVLAVDTGEVRTDTASRWLSSTMLGIVSEFQARQTAETTRDAKANAVARGIPPWGIMPLGYTAHGEDRRIHVNADVAPIVRQAFELRETGAPIDAVRAFLSEQGHPLSFRSVHKMLRNRFYLGELHYGKLSNLHSHEAIVDSRLFRSVASMRGDPRGPQGHSPNLLARQGLLYCGTCGVKMIAGGQNLKNRPDGPRKRYYDYRCAAIMSPNCPRRPYISAVNLDAYIVDQVKRRLADARGRWSSDERLVEAEAVVADKQARFEASVRTFDGLGDEDVVKTQLREMQADLNAARERLEELRVAFGTPALLTMGDWADLTLAEQRSILRALIKRIRIAPGRGTLEERVTLEAFEE